MTTPDKDRVLEAYIQASHTGASNHEEAAEVAARELGVPVEAVNAVVFEAPEQQ